jgi:indoleamine 2,3-dioxygenase
MPAKEFNLQRGFLPSADPVDMLPQDYALWEGLGKELPKLLVAGQIVATFNSIPTLNTQSLTSDRFLERAMLLLSFFGHAYVWGGSKVQSKIPASIAVPWYEVATKLKRFPVLSYASYALQNWRRLDQAAPVALGNIVLSQNFLGGLDEEWFVLVHVDIEMKAAQGLQHCLPLQESAANNDLNQVIENLKQIAFSLEQMCRTLDRMTENCDPYIYYHRVRPYIHGWKDNPALPQGLFYEGVAAYQNKPQHFRGETGAQSSIVPCFDALLGVVHRNDPLRTYLNEMRDYMPASHRLFLEQIECQGSIRQFILEHHKKHTTLRELYNSCLQSLSYFRQTHLRFAAHYIQKQSQTSLANPTEIGTGGTPFMNYLRKHKDETLDFLLP